MDKNKCVLVIGGGLAGCECALILAEQGIHVKLYEQKPHHYSDAHISEYLGELVCSNSFRSDKADGPQSSGVGLLKQELRALKSPLLKIADSFRVPAGKALAVDRELFSKNLTEQIQNNPCITLERQEIKDCEQIESLRIQENAHYVVIAAGPLCSTSLAKSLSHKIGSEYCYFYDAIAPIILADSLDNSIVFRGSRYDNVPPPPYNDEIANSDELSALSREKMRLEIEELHTQQREKEKNTEKEQRNNSQNQAHNIDTGDYVNLQLEIQPQDDGDYLNCPMHKFEYEAFYKALLEAEKVPSHNFEKEVHFEGCMPIEALAERGERTLTFGPLKPVGFTDPRTGRRPYALLQLRAENNNAQAFNLVGCQTKMTYEAQDKVFRLVPGLSHVEFLRYGSVHRNTYVNAPLCLDNTLAIKGHEHIHLAGQITGVEGYVESIACGHWAGLCLIAKITEKDWQTPPNTCALGALLAHLQNTKAKNFQPSNIHFGLMPELAEKTKKKNRKELMAERSHTDFLKWQTCLNSSA